MRKKPAAAAFLALFLIIGVLVGCNGEPTQGIDQPWTSVREARGDTVLVRTTRGSIWRDTLALMPELSIGVLDGVAYILGAVAGLDVDSAGRIYLVDRQAQKIMVFSPQGNQCGVRAGQ